MRSGDNAFISSHQNRNTIRASYQQHQPWLGRDHGICHRSPGLSHPEDILAMYLFQVRDSEHVSELIPDQIQVCGPRVRRIRAIDGQVQAVKGRRTDPTEPIGEGQFGGASANPLAEQSYYFKKSGTSRSSS